MIGLRNKKETAVGLDIGRHAIKAVWVERAGGVVRVVRCDSLRLPPEAARLREAIAPWVAKNGLARESCALSIPGQQVVFHPLTVAPGDPRDMSQIASMQVLQITDMAPEAMSYGYSQYAGRPGERRLLLAMARSSVVEGVLDVARGLNLRVVELLPGPLAALKGLNARHRDPVEFRLFVDVGQGTTSVVVANAAGAVFARTFALGGQTFTDAIAKALRLPTSQAENVKTAGADLRQEGRPEAVALQSAANLWTNELQSCLSVYRNLYSAPGVQPRRLLLTGGGAELPGLAEYAAAKLGLPVERATLQLDVPPEESPGRLAVAVGLALAGLQDRADVISLLPAHLVNELVFRRQKPLWIGAAAVAGLILAVSLVAGYRDIRRKEHELDAQRTSLARRQELVAKIEHTRARCAVVQNMAAGLRHEIQGGSRVHALIDLVARVKAPDDVITCVADAASYFAPPLPAGAAPASGRPVAPVRTDTNLLAAAEGPFQRMLIEGYARRSNLRTVRDLIATLKRDPMIKSVDLLSDELVPESPSAPAPRNAFGQRFVIDIRLAPL